MYHDPDYVDQQPDALRLSVTEGLLDRSEFKVYRRGTQLLSGIHIDAAIIGASHVISFDFGGLLIQELFACVRLPGVPGRTLHELARAPVQYRQGGFSYEFTVRRIVWQTLEEPREVEELARTVGKMDNPHLCLVQEFPSRDTRARPKTIVVGYPDDSDRGGLTVETIHSYPNVQQLVVSRTRLIRER